MTKYKKTCSVFLLLFFLLQCQLLGSYSPDTVILPADAKQSHAKQVDVMGGEEEGSSSRENQKIREALRLAGQARTAGKVRQQQDEDIIYTALSYSQGCPGAEKAAGETEICLDGITGEVTGERGPPYTPVTQFEYY